MNIVQEFVINTLGVVGTASEIKIFRQKFNQAIYEYALKRCKGNQSKAAKMLGMNRNTLKKEIIKYDINPLSFKSK